MRVSEWYNSFFDCIFLLWVIKCDGKMFIFYFFLFENFNFKSLVFFFFIVCKICKFGNYMFGCLYKVNMLLGFYNIFLNVMIKKNYVIFVLF